ncbi:MAGUK p55 subfamily member 5-like isoform X2 [Anneissia japonica]|uniref:MAGUK p55 subfamily member 5-like isoform X2 n=1 Tax=Anneissia japonica TaxID=1529436 RepID=UPI0014255ED3|nr:MAGUK p55 subfamily member 5-like isoform X2 [Anneissia japonica]
MAAVSGNLYTEYPGRMGPKGIANGQVQFPATRDLHQHNGLNDSQEEEELDIPIVMYKGEDRFGFSIMGGVDEGFIPRVDAVSEGSPAERSGLELGDEIITVNGESLEHAAHHQVIDFIHQCIQSRKICLRVRRQVGLVGGGSVGQNNIHEAYVIAVDTNAREKLAKLTAQKNVTTIDMATMPPLQPLKENGVGNQASYSSSSSRGSTARDLTASDGANAPLLLQKSSPIAREEVQLHTLNGHSTKNDCGFVNAAFEDELQFNGLEEPRPGTNFTKSHKVQQNIEKLPQSDIHSAATMPKGTFREMAVDCPADFVAASGMKNPPQVVSNGNLPQNRHDLSATHKNTNNSQSTISPSVTDRTQALPNSSLKYLVADDSPPEPSKTIGLEDLLNTLDRVQSKLKSTEDQKQVSFLQDLFTSKDFQDAVTTHNKMMEVVKVGGHEPLLDHSVVLMDDVREILQDTHSKDADELRWIFDSVNMKCVLQAHDDIAEEEFMNQTLAEEDDLERQSEITEDSVKIVRIDKSEEPLGATILNHGDCVYIGRIVKGGAADKSGLLHEGDEILEINGQEMKGRSVNEICDIMGSLSGTLTFLLIPSKDTKQQVGENVVHVRAHFNYDPDDDEYIPCRELGLSFQKGDILHVIKQEDNSWWQAYRDGEEDQVLAGLIPSKSFTQQREAMKQTLQDDPEPQKKLMCGCKSKKKKKKKKVLYNANENEYESEEILTYEEVGMYQPNIHKKRPIVLVGPHSVGRHELRQKLLEDSTKFASAVPHTSRAKKDFEVEAEDYYFVTRQRFEQDITAGKFVEHGEFMKSLYGTSLDAIRLVVNSGKVCVLNLQPQSLKILKNSDLKPYFVFVYPPSIDRLRQQRAEAGETLKEEALRDIIETGRTMEDLYGHYFDFILVHHHHDRALEDLITEIERIETEPQWVPVSWLG